MVVSLYLIATTSFFIASRTSHPPEQLRALR
jgi:hypothetical protein